MWTKADEELRKDPSKCKDLDQFDNIMELHYGAHLAPFGTQERREQMLGFTAAKIDELEVDGRLKSLGVSAGRTKQLFDSAIKYVVRSKDVISAAAQPCLPASVACAGVMLLLSVYVQGEEERDTFYEGMNNISWSIYRLAEYEDLLWNRHGEEPSAEVEHLFVAACSNVLYFQARAARYLDGNRFKRGLRDAFRIDGWNDLIRKTKEAENGIENRLARTDSKDIRTILSKIDRIDAAQNVERWREEADEFLQKLYERTYPYEDRKNRNNLPVKGTCKWFTNQDKFKDWESPVVGQNSSSRLLYVTADPGCGKSVLSRHLVDTVLPRNGRTVCYAFFKDDFEEQKSCLGALCALLHQLLVKNPHLFANRSQILASFKSQGSKFFDSFSSVWTAFTTCASFQETVCVLDALDECRGTDRSQLFAAIGKARVPTLQFLLTCRPYEYITRDFRSQNDFETSSIHIQGDQGSIAEEIVQEIQLVVRSRIDDTAKFWSLTISERQLLEKQLSEVSNRTYLWITLVFDGLLSRRSGIAKQNIMDVTASLPQGIFDVYEELLSRSQDHKKTRRILQSVIAAGRPLSLAEMAIAMAWDNQQSWSDLVNVAIPEHRVRESIRDLCGLFVSVVDDKIYLLHQTAREFLLQKPSAEDGDHTAKASVAEDSISSWQCSMSLIDSNTILAEVCIQVLHLYPLQEKEMEEYWRDENGSEDGLSDSANPMFLYASEFWSQHYRLSHVKFQSSVTRGVQDLWLPSLKRKFWVKFWTREDDCSGAALLCAAAQGVDKVVEQLIARCKVYSDCSNSINFQNGKGRTLLPDAVVANNPLTKGKADPNLATEGGWTPLNLAAYHGHKEVVDMLLTEGKADPNLATEDGRTPLYVATGCAEIVDILLTKGKADPNLAAKGGWTPLNSAVDDGYKDIVDILLTKGKADPNLATEDGWTPLNLAAFDGYKEIVDILLTKSKADPNLATENGQTPLYTAAGYGHKEVVDILLTKGKADPNLANKDSWTPLYTAARHGYKEIVDILLTKGKADPNLAAINGCTPLYVAAFNGYKEVVDMLLTKGKADPNLAAKGGWTPLYAAATYGYKEVVDVLLTKSKADPNLAATNGCTPLYIAAEKGHKELVDILLTKGKADPNLAANSGCTTLYAAANFGHTMIVEILLNMVDVNLADGKGNTPLHAAAWSGHTEVVKLLLTVGKADLTLRNRSEKTALTYAKTSPKIQNEDDRKATIQLLTEAERAVNSKSQKLARSDQH